MRPNAVANFVSSAPSNWIPLAWNVIVQFWYSALLIAGRALAFIPALVKASGTVPFAAVPGAVTLPLAHWIKLIVAYLRHPDQPRICIQLYWIYSPIKQSCIHKTFLPNYLNNLSFADAINSCLVSSLKPFLYETFSIKHLPTKSTQNRHASV